MKVCVQLWGVLKDRKEGTLEALRELKQLGFNIIEPCIALEPVPGLEHVIWPREWFNAHAGEITETGLEIISCHIFADDVARQAHELVAFAEESGIRQFVVKSPRTLSEDTIGKAGSGYCVAADALASVGAKLLLHNEAEDIIARINSKTAYEYLLDICDGKVGAQVDVGWVYAAGESPEMLLARNAARVKSMHFKDFAGKAGAYTEVVPGTGNVNTLACIAFAIQHDCPQIFDMDSFPNGIATDLSIKDNSIWSDLLCQAGSTDQSYN